MTVVAERRCDRCGATVGENVAAGYGVSLTVGYHRPRKLDLCPQCEKNFTLWLGKHPLWETPLLNILEGLAVGQGYPTPEEVRAYRATPLCAQCKEAAP